MSGCFSCFDLHIWITLKLSDLLFKVIRLQKGFLNEDNWRLCSPLVCVTTLEENV
jgi:hypothetical protein